MTSCSVARRMAARLTARTSSCSVTRPSVTKRRMRSNRHRMLGCHRRCEPETAGEPMPGLVHYLIERRDDEQREQRARYDATDDRDTKRSAELRALTTAERHRNHAGDEREGRHQNGTQTDRARFDERFTQPLALLLAAPPGELKEQDRVLCDDAHEQDHADERHDVDRVA